MEHCLLQLQIDELKEKHDGDIEYVMSLISLIRGDNAVIKVTVKDSSGNPIPDMPITNITSSDGNPVKTNKNGVAEGLAKAITGFYPRIDSYIDVAYVSRSPNTLDLTAGNTYEFVLTLSHNNFYNTYSSANVRFTPMTKKISFSIVGGGGAGSHPYEVAAGYPPEGLIPGGGGGGSNTIDGLTISPYSTYYISIGSGGKAGSGSGGTLSVRPGPGGTSSAFGYYAAGGGVGRVSSTECVGGTPGPNGGQGGSANSPNGADRTGVIYTSFTNTTPSPGGGGCGTQAYGSPGAIYYGGTTGGGHGSYTGNGGNSTNSPSNGYMGGGGGGLGINYSGYSGKGGDGYCGVRMYTVG